MRQTGFETRDPGEFYDEFLSRALRRSVRLLRLASRERFHLSARAVTLELLSASVIAVAGGDPVSRAACSGYSLARVEAGVMERRFNGHANRILHPGDGDLVGPGQEFTTTVRTVRGSNVASAIALSAALVEREAGLLIGEPVRGPLVIAGHLDLRRSTYLGQRVSYLLAELRREEGLFDRFSLHGIEVQRSLVAALIEQTHNNYQHLLRSHGRFVRRRLAKAEEYIEAHLLGQIIVGDMAHAAGVSARTLRDDCQHARGMSPETLLRTMRLRAAHKRLENPLPHDTVASIARQYHFTNAGRFAQFHRREFRNESPLETLRLGRKKLSVKSQSI